MRRGLDGIAVVMSNLLVLHFNLMIFECTHAVRQVYGRADSKPFEPNSSAVEMRKMAFKPDGRMRRNEAYGAGTLLNGRMPSRVGRQLRETKLHEGVPATRYPSQTNRALHLYSGLMLAACSPFGPCFVSKLTF